MLTFVLSIIVGVVFNVIIIPVIGSESIPGEATLGIAIGLILNIIFGIFLTLTNSMWIFQSNKIIILIFDHLLMTKFIVILILMLLILILYL